MAQLLMLCASTAGGAGLTPGWGPKIPNATWPKFREKKRELRGRGKAYRERGQIQRHVYGNSTQIGYIGILMPQNFKNPGPQPTQ